MIQHIFTMENHPYNLWELSISEIPYYIYCILRYELTMVLFKRLIYDATVNTRVKKYQKRLMNDELVDIKTHNSKTLESRLTFWLLQQISPWARHQYYLNKLGHTKSLGLWSALTTYVATKLPFWDEKYSPRTPDNEHEFIISSENRGFWQAPHSTDWFIDKPFTSFDCAAGLEWLYDQTTIFEYTKVKMDGDDPVFYCDTRDMRRCGTRHPDYVQLGSVVKLKLTGGRLKLMSIDGRKKHKKGVMVHSCVAWIHMHLILKHQIGHRYALDMAWYLEDRCDPDSFLRRLLSPFFASNPFENLEAAMLSIPFKGGAIGLNTPYNVDGFNALMDEYHDSNRFRLRHCFDMWWICRKFCKYGDYKRLKHLFRNTYSMKYAILYWEIIEHHCHRFVEYAFSECNHAKRDASRFLKFFKKLDSGAVDSCLSLKEQTKRATTIVLCMGMWHEVLFSDQFSSQVLANPFIMETFPKKKGAPNGVPHISWIRVHLSNALTFKMLGMRYIDIDGRHAKNKREHRMMILLRNDICDLGCIIPSDHFLNPVRVNSTVHQSA